MAEQGGRKEADEARRIRWLERASAALLAAALMLGAADPASAQQAEGGPAEPAAEAAPTTDAATGTEPEPELEPEPEPEPAKLQADPLSAEIAEKGLGAVEARLAALTTRTPEQTFALAGVRFLKAVERASQLRYRYDLGAAAFAPVLRLTLPKNESPEPFEPEVVARLFEGVLEDMAGVEAALAAIPKDALDGDGFGLTLRLSDLWLDANGNGAPDVIGTSSEWLLELSGRALGMPVVGMRGTLVRFDAADVAWLRAYAHMLSGFSEAVLALDPTTALERVRPGWEAAAAYRAADAFGMGEDKWIDQAATVLLMLRGEPDGARMKAALRHFEAMIAQNKVFWARLALEKDDQGEWIPNPAQQSALGGLRVSEETAKGWVAVLEETEKILKGELLISFWRYQENEAGERVGVNLRKVFEDPAPVDLILWLQGGAAAPYLETGEIATGEAWTAFQTIAGGRFFTFALWFN